ncbi:hypothetical protein PUN28_017086 [Cardiocondyla obscurior]|uniref:Uncharacterized protein n=1 Tax=Cardiocondyla obscurior TaxID=286306 RepID=A0AAW2EQ18_9HYME
MIFRRRRNVLSSYTSVHVYSYKGRGQDIHRRTHEIKLVFAIQSMTASSFITFTYRGTNRKAKIKVATFSIFHV